MDELNCKHFRWYGQFGICALKQEIICDTLSSIKRKCLLCDENTTVKQHTSFTLKTKRKNCIAPVDCDFCRNANTDEELTHDNDLSYLTCGRIMSDNIEIHFRTGDKRKTIIIISQKTDRGWETVAEIEPNYCPCCGRNLFENKMYKR